MKASRVDKPEVKKLLKLGALFRKRHLDLRNRLDAHKAKKEKSR